MNFVETIGVMKSIVLLGIMATVGDALLEESKNSAVFGTQANAIVKFASGKCGTFNEMIGCDK